MPLTFTRQATAKKLLEIQWEHPAPLQLEEQTGPTVSSQRMVALPKDKAIAWLAKDDPRPLLILRECTSCKGTDDALLTRKVNNEKTQLLTRWFRCVKLAPNVMDKNHTFHALFAGQRAPHLFLASRDGETITPLDGQQSQSILWREMKRVIRVAYERDPDQALRNIFRVMDKLDTVDAKLNQYREHLEAAVEKHGPRHAKVRQMRVRVAKAEHDREVLLTKKDKVADLKLRDVDTKPQPAAKAPKGRAGAPE